MSEHLFCARRGLPWAKALWQLRTTVRLPQVVHVPPCVSSSFGINAEYGAPRARVLRRGTDHVKYKMSDGQGLTEFSNSHGDEPQAAEV